MPTLALSPLITSSPPSVGVLTTTNTTGVVFAPSSTPTAVLK